jgi:hypothetical protein
LQEQRRLDVVEDDGLGDTQPETPAGPQAFIPCPVCRAPIAIENPSEPLPRSLTCGACGTLLER